MESIWNLIPAPPRWEIDWAALEETELAHQFAAMAATPQNPDYHAEGDVWTHTKLVCQALCEMEGFRRLPPDQRTLLFLAALLHDVGKSACTRLEEGRWVSPGHAAAGAAMARNELWTVLDLCGTEEGQQLRETVCCLIRYHTLPAYAVLREDGVRVLRRVASNGELLPQFHLELLCLLAEADARGRRCGDQADVLDRVRLCRELAQEAGCFSGPYPFSTAHTGFAYCSGREVPPDYPLYDGTWGQVILLSGLPGTGKDYWLAHHCPELPEISLDKIRLELGISPTESQSRVVAEARERAKALLRRKEPFVWNATDLTAATRQKQVGLFTAYGASVGIVYLETGWAEQLRRNRSREKVVPEWKIRGMLEKLTPPERFEAHQVEWYCV